MKLIFRQCNLSASEVDPETLALREFTQFISQGAVIGAQSIQDIDAHLVNIVINDQTTYWNVPRDIFEVISDQQPLQPQRCCG